MSETTAPALTTERLDGEAAIVATRPRTTVDEHGLSVWFRLAVLVADGPTCWYDVTAAGVLARNVVRSLEKGQRTVVSGPVKSSRTIGDDGSERVRRVLTLERCGHDLSYGVASWRRAA
ncbi:MAG: single-stranded DNA-binding protein [Curtobacterium sp.]